MKRVIILFILGLLTAGSSIIIAQQPIYVYRNDGIINVFSTEYCDSITYSPIDVDSVTHPEICTIEIYACDSIYRIPLESIDSVSFVTPSTIIKPGIINLDEELLPWVSGRKGLTIRLKSETPASVIPSVGQTVVSLSDPESPMGGVFMGKVSNVNREDDEVKIECEPIYIEDAFERFYANLQSETAGSRAEAFTGTGWKLWKPDKFEVDLFNFDIFNQSSVSYNFNDELALTIEKPIFAYSFQPEIRYNAYLVYNPPYNISTGLSIIGDYYIENRKGLSGNIGLSSDMILWKPLPLMYGLADFFFEVGLYGHADVGVALEQSISDHFRSVFHWEWSKNDLSSVKPVNKFWRVSHEEEGGFAVDGTLSGGIYLKAGTEFIMTRNLDIAEIDLRFELGSGVEGSFLPLKSDIKEARTNTTFYNRLKKANLRPFGEIGLYAEAKLFNWSLQVVPSLGGSPLRTRLYRNDGISMVPSFSDFSLSQNSSGILYAKAKAEGFVLGNDLGFALSENGNFLDEDYVYVLKGYRGPSAEISHIYTNRPVGGNYEAFPLVKWLGVEMIAGEGHPHNIDMDLPSGTKWCCINLGANNPENSGNYYALNATKDIATEVMGDGYKTPTKKQFEELLNHTTQHWGFQNGVRGMIFEAKNGNTLFFPAAAHLWWDGEEKKWDINNAGSGAYWTSTESDEDYNYFLEFDNEEKTPFFGDRDVTRNRLCIRPVYIGD